MRALSVGIDVSVTHGLDVVAMGHDRQVIAVCSRVSPAGASQLVDELEPAVVCIDSPAQWSTSGTNREAERALRRLGINAFPTPVVERQRGSHRRARRQRQAVGWVRGWRRTLRRGRRLTHVPAGMG